SARKAIMQECQRLQINNVNIEDIYLGNGVSELITIAMQALLNDSDEVLIPAPDYPLWTAAVSLSGGKPIHYLCDEQTDWYPSITDIESRITGRTRALVIINPNNPTGAVYSREILLDLVDLARKHKLILFADEIYSKIVYDDSKFFPAASLCDDLFIVTFNGLSKSYRLAGFRSGWMILSGPKNGAENYIEGLEVLTNMRLCANVPAQLAVQTALGGHQSINEFVLPGGRLRRQRDLSWELLNQIPGLTCVKPTGAIYMFPRLDPAVYKIEDDLALVMALLHQEKILVVQGSAFNMGDKQHLRLVFLPNEDELKKAIGRIDRLLANYRTT
ncbi:MAG: pyridoxal phosphate-dependent aminotransferase, partial [Pseudomonadota bacterium]|nr:pyridoxal phosphate-dependent aminotransferase [Pseudomonadota bacterium]